MKTTLSRISFGKYTDLCLQLLSFIAMILVWAWADWNVFALFIEAVVQVMSCIVWSLYFTTDAPRHRAGTCIRRAFLIVLVVWVIGSVCSGAVAWLFLYLMVLLGPVMGIAYFVITLQEAAYYSKARKPFYLL